MTATLEKRVSRLEGGLPPPPPSLPPDDDRWPADDPPAWWALVPGAVRRYFLALLAEVGDEFARSGDAGEAWDATLARHPGAVDLLGLLEDHAERGGRVPLPVAQRAVVWAGWLRCWDAIADSATACRRYWGGGHGDVWPLWTDAGGARVLATWRQAGRRDRGLTETAGFGPVELALLDAAEEGEAPG